MCCVQVKSILKYLFPVPKDDSKRVVTFANQEDYISFRCSWATPIFSYYEKVGGVIWQEIFSRKTFYFRSGQHRVYCRSGNFCLNILSAAFIVRCGQIFDSSNFVIENFHVLISVTVGY